MSVALRRDMDAARLERWDRHFLALAEHVASWSKDPSTQTGAVIVRPDRTIASVGYAGFPRGCDDSDSLYADRNEKYARIVRCEMNAVLSAREPLQGRPAFPQCPRNWACCAPAGGFAPPSEKQPNPLPTAGGAMT